MFECSAVISFLAFTLLISAILRILYSLVIKGWNYFSDRNVAFERGLPILGAMYDILLNRKHFANALQDLYNKHPNRKFFGMYDMGGRTSYMIRDLDITRNILIKDFDYFVNHSFHIDQELDPLFGRTLFTMTNHPWREMRSIMSPLFTGRKMRHMLTLINDCGRDFNEFIRKDIVSKSAKSQEYDMMNLLMRLTNDMIGSTAFGIQINSLQNSDNEFFEMGKAIAEAVNGMKIFIIVACPKLAKWLKLKLITDNQDQFFRNVIQNTLEQRQKNNIVRKDMLQLLMQLKEGKLSNQNDNEADQDTGFATISEVIASKTEAKLKNWTDDDIVAQCLSFFLAGFTGLSITFCYFCHEMALNPEMQNRLYEEILETKEQLNGKQLTFEAVQKMKYMDMVITEVMRLWPVGTMMDRVASKQYLLEDHDGTKVLLQPNDMVWIPVFAFHRDPKYYPNPEVFDPERFSDENKHNIHPCAYLPFGNGPRACIASRMALLQMKAILYHILLEFKIECSPKTQTTVKFPTGTNALQPDGGFFNQLTLRN